MGEKSSGNPKAHISNYSQLQNFKTHKKLANDYTTFSIKYIIDHFSLTKEDAYAFGDGYNDQAMFREVGQRIAMGNGVDVLKEKATYITDTVDNEGIYKALKHYELL